MRGWRAVLAAFAAVLICAPANAHRHRGHRHTHHHHHGHRHHSAMSIQDDIRAYAQQRGLDPAYALAVAERESSFRPNAHASKTMDGLFQMSGAVRGKYGVPTGADVGTQVQGFAGYTDALRQDMAQRLGREPTPSETYLGHYWGPARAAGVINGNYAGLPARDVFTPRELAENPNLKPDEPVGDLANGIMGDINRRYAKFGGQGAGTVEDPAAYLTPTGDTAGDTTAAADQPKSGTPDAKAAQALQPSAPLSPSPNSSTSRAPVAPSLSPSSDDAATATAALTDAGGGKSLGDDLAEAAKNLGGAMSQAPAPVSPSQNSTSDLLQQLALAQEVQAPVEGLPSLPGQQATSSNLPGSNQRAPSYLDPRMFGIQPSQQG